MSKPCVSQAQTRVWSARGGHGATTVAGALGAFLGSPALSHDPDAFGWLWSEHEKTERTKHLRITDAGVIDTSFDDSHINVVVLRGPCSLGIRSIVSKVDLIDHLVVIREPWRSIRSEDIEAALSMKIAAEITHSPRVARLADAGLLGARIDGLEEFAELKAWALAQWSAPAQDPSKPGLHS